MFYANIYTAYYNKYLDKVGININIGTVQDQDYLEYFYSFSVFYDLL